MVTQIFDRKDCCLPQQSQLKKNDDPHAVASRRLELFSNTNYCPEWYHHYLYDTAAWYMLPTGWLTTGPHHCYSSQLSCSIVIEAHITQRCHAQHVTSTCPSWYFGEIHHYCNDTNSAFIHPLSSVSGMPHWLRISSETGLSCNSW